MRGTEVEEGERAHQSGGRRGELVFVFRFFFHLPIRSSSPALSVRSEAFITLNRKHSRPAGLHTSGRRRWGVDGGKRRRRRKIGPARPFPQHGALG